MLLLSWCGSGSSCWQKLISCPFKCGLELFVCPVQSFLPPPLFSLGGPAVCRQPGERDQKIHQSWKKNEGDYFWPGSVPWSHLPSRPVKDWTSPAERVVVSLKWDGGGGKALGYDSALENQPIFTSCRLNKELQGWLLSQGLFYVVLAHVIQRSSSITFIFQALNSLSK